MINIIFTVDSDQSHSLFQAAQGAKNNDLCSLGRQLDRHNQCVGTELFLMQLAKSSSNNKSPAVDYFYETDLGQFGLVGDLQVMNV